MTEKTHKLNWHFVFVFVLVLLTLPAVRMQTLPTSLHNGSLITTCTTATMAARTIFEFWRVNSDSCAFDAKNLLAIHAQLLNYSKKNTNDRVTDLLTNHVSSTLVDTLFNELLATISTKTLATKPDLEELIDNLYKMDPSLTLQIWQRVLDETSQFINFENIVQELVLLANDKLQIQLLEYIVLKYGTQNKNNPQYLPILTYGLTAVLQRRQQTMSPVVDPSVGKLLGKLPEQLLTIYQAWNYDISLLNRQTQEHIFAHRSNGPAANKRYLFSYIPFQNKFRVRGKFRLQFNAKGQLAFGVLYNGSYSFMVAEEKSVSICLDCTIDASHWWQILWMKSFAAGNQEEFMLLQNVATQDILCANGKYDDSFILISTLNLNDHMTDLACQWQAVKSRK